MSGERTRLQMSPIMDNHSVQFTALQMLTDLFLFLLKAAGWCPESKSPESAKVKSDRRTVQL